MLQPITEHSEHSEHSDMPEPGGRPLPEIRGFTPSDELSAKPAVFRAAGAFYRPHVARHASVVLVPMGLLAGASLGGLAPRRGRTKLRQSEIAITRAAVFAVLARPADRGDRAAIVRSFAHPPPRRRTPIDRLPNRDSMSEDLPIRRSLLFVPGAETPKPDRARRAGELSNP